MKKILALVLALALLTSMAACASKTQDTQTPAQDTAPAADTADTNDTAQSTEDTAQKTYTLNVSGIDAGLGLFPAYVAKEFGWFQEAGLDVNFIGFTNGPVQMEAIDSWDLGLTGVGGVLSGTISYDAILLGTVGTDYGTTRIFVRPDSPVALAGTGSNANNADIYGDAESWKQMSINCTYGNILHYMLLRTLSGFGLTLEDVNVNWMDQPTCNAAFLAGEGDATCTTGPNSLVADKAEFVVASSGEMAQTGVLTNIMANPASYANEETREAMKIFLTVFFRAAEWVTENPQEATSYMVDWCIYSGNTIDEEIAYQYLILDKYYTLEDNYNSLHETASDGGDYCQVQEQILNVLKFFIETENYQPGDDEIFLRPEHFDSTLIDELYAVR